MKKSYVFFYVYAFYDDFLIFKNLKLNIFKYLCLSFRSFDFRTAFRSKSKLKKKSLPMPIIMIFLIP